MLKKIVFLIIIVSIMTTATISGVLYYKSIKPYKVLPAFEENSINVVMEDKVINVENSPIIENNNIFLPVDLIKKNIYEDIRLNEKGTRLYIDINIQNFKLETKKLNKRIENGIEINVISRNIDDVEYINIKGLEKIFGINLKYNVDTNILIIDKIRKSIQIADVKDKVYLRPKKSSFSFKMDKFKKGDKLIVFEDEGKWLKVRAQNGYIGYVLDKKVDKHTEKIDINTKLNKTREDWDINEKINLVWEYVHRNSPNLRDEQTIEGLDVVAPTWFSIVSKEGLVINNADINYVKEAHNKGYKVWALIDNSFNKDLTHSVLKSEEAQNNIINQLLVYTSLYNIDGINIDFENVYYEDKDRLTEFVSKLTNALKEQNLIVSMDMTIPSASKNWSKFYDRKKLSKIVDYCIVMTYDEHWASCPTSGSVASIGWVNRGIQKTLRYIPKEKLLMGVPFYTRRWEEARKSNGKIEVKSKALSMKTVEEIIDNNELEKVWLEEEGQHYIEYEEEDKRYRIWIEDDKSIELKAKLVHKYDLAGVASWRKGFETSDVWTVLNNVVKEYDKELIVENK